MTHRIDSRQTAAQSTSELPVISSSASDSVAAIPFIKPVKVAPSRPGNQPPAPEPAVRSTIPTLPIARSTTATENLLSNLQPESDTEDESPFELSRFSYVYGMPSWLVSFVLHLFVLLLLALLTIGAAKGPQILSLEMSDSEPAMDVQMFEVAVDFEETPPDDDAEQLEDFEEEQLSPESSVELARDLIADLKAGSLDDSGTGDDQSASMKLAQGDGKSVKFFGAAAQGTKFVFVIDCSQSMEDFYRWEAAKRELKYAIDKLTGKQKFYVFLYNSYAYGMSNSRPKLVPPSKVNRNKTFDWLDNQYPIGSTMPREAMRAALELKPDAVFLLSDGELRDDTVRFLQRYNRHRDGDQYNEARQQIPVHTIFLGNGIGRVTMRAIADQNNGSFTAVRN